MRQIVAFNLLTLPFGVVLAILSPYIRPYVYRARHHVKRGDMSTMEFVGYRVSLAVPAEAVPVAELPAVAPKLGAGRYAHLRTDELDTTAERFLLLHELGIAPPRSAWLDEWAATDDLIGAAT